MTDRQDKDRIINLLLDFIKTVYDKDLEITILQAKRVIMIRDELEKLGLNLWEKLKEI